MANLVGKSDLKQINIIKTDYSPEGITYILKENNDGLQNKLSGSILLSATNTYAEDNFTDTGYYSMICVDDNGETCDFTYINSIDNSYFIIETDDNKPLESLGKKTLSINPENIVTMTYFSNTYTSILDNITKEIGIYSSYAGISYASLSYIDELSTRINSMGGWSDKYYNNIFNGYNDKNNDEKTNNILGDNAERNHITCGGNNNIDGTHNNISGSHNETHDSHNNILGSYNKANKEKGVLIGTYLTTISKEQIILGKYNVESDANFIIANGNEKNPNNILEINEVNNEKQVNIKTSPNKIYLSEDSLDDYVKQTIKEEFIKYIADASGNILTQAGEQFNGLIASIMPIGSIIMWGASTIPVGWHICDGTAVKNIPGAEGLAKFMTVLPDLVNRFPKGTSNENLLNQAGGGPITLKPENLPQHKHIYFGDDQLAVAAHYKTNWPVYDATSQYNGNGLNVGNSSFYYTGTSNAGLKAQMDAIYDNAGGQIPNPPSQIDVDPHHTKLYFIIKYK